MSEHRASCRLCLNGCAIRVEIEDGRAVRVGGDKDDPVYRGFTCVKGRNQARLLAHPDRVIRPRKRLPDGSFIEITTRQAITEIAGRLRTILDDHGPRAIAGYLGTNFAASVPTMPLFAAFVSAIKTPMVFSPGTIDKPGKKIAQALHGDWMAPAVGFDDPEVILLIGANPLISFTGFPYGNVGKWLNERLAAGTQLIVIDPRRSDVARRAHIHLQARAGHDVPILAAMLKIILDEQLYDAEFVTRHTQGLDTLRAVLAPIVIDQVANRADVSTEDLVLAARTLAATRRGYIMAGTGPNMSGAGTLIEYLVLNLQTVCGFWLREGDRVRHPGALAAPLKACAQVAPPQPAFGFGEKLRVRGLTNTAAGMPTAALADEILLEGKGQVRALISVGGNPVGAWPDQMKTIEAMNALDLLVQIDPWMSATAKLADYVIAPRLWLEVPGTTQILDWLTRYGTNYGQMEPYAHYSPAIAEPPADSDLIEEWEFFYEVAKEMGLALTVSPQLGPDMPSFELDMHHRPTSDELLEMLSKHARVPLEQIKQAGRGALYNEPATYVAPGEPDCDRLFELADPDMMNDLAGYTNDFSGAASGEFAFRLLCRRMMHVYNSSFVGALPEGTRPYNPAFMNPGDLESLALGAGDVVEISNEHATILAIVQPDETLRAGVVSMSFGFGSLPENDADLETIGSNPSRLLSDDQTYDRYSGQPLMTNVRIAVRPAMIRAPVDVAEPAGEPIILPMA